MTMTSNSLEQVCSLGSVVRLHTLVIYQRQPSLMLATSIRMISGFRWSFTHHVATGDTGDYYLGMPYKNPEAQREWQRSHREDTPAKRAHRREYERERKNRKRVEAILQLPEPERSQRLERNANRRAKNLRWSSTGN